MYLKGITTTTRTIRCTSCGRSHEDWNHFWKCPKYKPIWKKLINLMNETEIAEESGKTHDYTQERVYLGMRKDGKALNRGHALMHMLTWKYIIIAHTKASIEGIPPKNIKTDIIWKQIMSRMITRIHTIQRLMLGSGVDWRCANCHAFSGCGAGAPRRKFWGYVITFN